MAGFAAVFLASSALADECKTRYAAGNSASVLADVLDCMNRRIDAINGETRLLKRNALPDNTGDMLQDNAFFSIYVAGYSSNGQLVTFSLAVHNKTATKIFLAWERQPTLTDETDAFVNPQKATMDGISRGERRARFYLIISANATKTIPVESKRDTLKGDHLVIDANIQQLDNERQLHLYSIRWQAPVKRRGLSVAALMKDNV